MRKTLTRLALAGAAVTVLATGAAMAQIPAPPVPPTPPAPPMDDMMAMGPGMMFMHHGRATDPESRAQRLRDVLQLRPDQDAALKAYVDATSPKIIVRDEDDRKDGDKSERPVDRSVERKPPTTLERLDRMSKTAEALQKRVAATRAFYTALSPSQQKAFDALGLEGGGDHMFIRRFETHGPAAFKGGERRVIIQRKVG
ncbi:Spy/CpxP family protein refolding chaperone [Caulobacter sp.]|uniref:Spy/CpxP family protein refolding chaperone n=1 Tax=Caulobacter sp. TaxID=78 RepID=UPI002B48A29C|nr:Spy/CpxP family protein refolding chaperone [Caulobacter sp.]HJV41329.1 Spy/CpxP family protein refolding chaperone [Caulobacter sp.]